MASIIQIRRDDSANWTLVNPILAEGEEGYELDTGKLKFGDGIADWNSLPYFTTTGSGGTVTNIATTGPITGGPITSTGTIGITLADTSTDGYISSTDWNTFNNKGTGTVTSVNGTSNRITSTGGNTPIIDIGIDVITLTGAQALSNKTGLISQWTNDSGYITTTGITPAALTKTDDTNVTLTLGGTPSTALLQATSLTLGWTGTLADGRIASAATWNAKQDALVSGTNIKTVNSSSLLGSGNLAVGDALVANPLSQFAATTSAQLAGIISDETGSGLLVFATSPVLTTPTLGVATATSINGNIFTTGTYTLTGTAGKTLEFTNSLIFSGTDSTTMTFPSTSATIARTDAANTFIGASTANAWILTSPTITTKLNPTSDDGAPLGDTTHNWSDLFIASGGIINYANSNVVITHTSSILTIGTGTLKITTPTNTSTSVVTIDGTQTFTNKSMSEAQLTFTDITTNNASSSAHGFLPKLSNTSTTVLDGTGAYVDIRPKSGSVSGSDVTTTSATAVDITGMVAAVAANKRYRLTATMFIGCNNTGGVRFTASAPSGAAILSGILSGSAATAAAAALNRLSTFGTLTGSGATFNRANLSTGMVTWTVYFTTSSTTGNIQLQFASGNSGETSTVFVGSTMDIIEIQ